MLQLLTFAPAGGVRCPSPFGLKAEALLAMSGLEFETRPGLPMKSPTGKLPVLVDGSRTIADSSLIQRYLEDVKGVDFDGRLSGRQRAIAMAFRRMLEEHLYFALVHSRWIMARETTCDLFFGKAPWPVRRFVFPMLVRRIARDLKGQGLGRHPADEIARFGVSDLQAIETAMDGPFFFGDQPCSLDASLYGALENIVSVPVASPLQTFCQGSGKVAAFLDAFRAQVLDGRQP
ncbi:MAG: glutathione S-transferase family protein [Zhengella sp.]|uniref:glutathione S-transferase family protein n=1 Tax=Zhengella sp. TaxID=2282762 RepID=UPI001DF3469D|nr:glutathione S-transferase family protein [Notoacmeibacter sp.]MCC0028032.1 glutathione S-transferase family protein [Brucellaceae bacterium]